MKNKMSNNRITTGIAYAFFNCSGTLEQIQGAMPDIREDAHTPEELELLLTSTENIPYLGFDEKLMEKIRERKDHGILHSGVGVDAPQLILLTDLKYLLIGEYPSKSNQVTARELGDIINVIYGYSSDKQVFIARILYEENSEYVDSV